MYMYTTDNKHYYIDSMTHCIMDFFLIMKISIELKVIKFYY